MYETELAYTHREFAGMADWVNENLSPNARSGIDDAGYIAFATPFQLIDLVGLEDAIKHTLSPAVDGPNQRCRAGRSNPSNRLEQQSNPRRYSK